MTLKDRIKPIWKILSVEAPPPLRLSLYNTFRVGGEADGIVCPTSPTEVAKVIAFARENQIPWMTLGRGSNVLVSDEGFRGLVMVLASNLGRFRIEKESVVAEAGASLPLIAKRTGEMGLAGFEFAAGIPGAVGGAIRMNAGTGEGQIQDVVGNVATIGGDGARKSYNREDLQFGYRKSGFQTTGEVIVEATFQLRRDDPDRVKSRIRAGLDYRSKTQPLSVPSAGSVFKNPPGHSAGRLLDAAGCKGWRVGDAEVSRLHANWIVNSGEARARDIWDLICRMRSRVLETAGIRLQLELELVGSGFEDPV